MGARTNCGDAGRHGAPAWGLAGGAAVDRRRAAVLARLGTLPRESYGLSGLLILTCLAYVQVWRFGWVYDDANWLPEPVFTSWRHWPRLPFALAEWAGGGLPWAYHGLMLGLHLLNGLVLWMLARRWLSPVAVLLTLTLFWLHPIQVESVAYVTGGMEVLLTTYVLLALWCGLAGDWWVMLGAGSLFLAATLKLSALPVLVVVPITVANSRNCGRVVRNCGTWVAFGLGAVLAWPAIQVWGLRAMSVSDRVHAVNTLAASVWRLLALVIWPVGFSLEHAPVAGWAPWLAGLGALTAGVLAWRARWRAPWWAWLWMTGLLLPRALVPHDASPLTEHHTYAPFLAIWLLAGSALDRFVLKESYA